MKPSAPLSGTAPAPLPPDGLPPSRQEIEARAYAKWLSRGRPSGTEAWDWQEAESELRQARMALAQDRQGFQSLVQAAGAVIFSLGPDRGVREWNAAAERFHGWSRADVLNRDYLELCLRPADRPAVAVAIQRALDGEPASFLETLIHGRDGGERVLRWHAARLLSDRGQPDELLVVGQDVTDRRREEDAQHQAQWQLLLEQAPAILWSTDADLRFTSSLGSGLAALGLKPGQLVGQTLFEFLQTEDPDHPAILAHRRALAGASSTYEQVWGGQNFQVHVEPQHSTQAGTHGTVGIALNVSSRKRAEEALHRTLAELEERVAARTAELSWVNRTLCRQIQERERVEEAIKNSEALYHSLVEHLPQNIFRKDREGRFTFANERFCAMLGRPLADILGKTDADFYPPELAAKYRQDDDRVMATRELLEAVEEHVLPAGGRLYVHVVKTALRDYKGEVIGIQAIFWDVTAHKQAEEALRDRDARLHLALEGGRLGVWDWDTRTGEVTWMRGLEAIHGFPRHDPGTLPEYLQTVHPDDRERVTEVIDRAVQERGAYAVEYRVFWPDGSIHWVEGKGRLFQDATTRTVRLLGLCVDITDRKRAEQWTAAEHAVTRALVESPTLAAAAPLILRAIGEGMGWDVAAIWRADERASVLRRIGRWYAPDIDKNGDDPTLRELGYHTGIPGNVWASDLPVWVADVNDPASPFDATPLLKGLHGAVAFPIRGAARLLGVLEFYSRRVREPDDRLLRTLASIGSQIGQFLERQRAERALRVRAEKFHVARRIQQGLLPHSYSTPPGLEMAGGSWPAEETGGDYFDCFAMPAARFGVAVGDVSGHGIGAALLIAETRAYLRALAREFPDVGHVLEVTNRHLAEDVKGDHFVTLILAQIDLATRTLVYASAGHPTGYILDRGGEKKAELRSTGMPLGVEPASPIPVAAPQRLAAGDLVLLCSDGALEARSPRGVQFGSDRLLGVVRENLARPAAEIVEAVRLAILRFSHRTVADDITVVVIKVESCPAD